MFYCQNIQSSSHEMQTTKNCSSHVCALPFHPHFLYYSFISTVRFLFAISPWLMPVFILCISLFCNVLFTPPLSLFSCPACGQALERQKEYFDCIRNERDELRDELADLKGKSRMGEVRPVCGLTSLLKLRCLRSEVN